MWDFNCTAYAFLKYHLKLFWSLRNFLIVSVPNPFGILRVVRRLPLALKWDARGVIKFSSTSFIQLFYELVLKSISKFSKTSNPNTLLLISASSFTFFNSFSLKSVMIDLYRTSTSFALVQNDKGPF